MTWRKILVYQSQLFVIIIHLTQFDKYTFLFPLTHPMQKLTFRWHSRNPCWKYIAVNEWYRSLSAQREFMSSHGQRSNKTIPWIRNKLKKAGYPQQWYFYTLKLRKGWTILEFIFFDFVNYNLNHSMTHPENWRKSITANPVN